MILALCQLPSSSGGMRKILPGDCSSGNPGSVSLGVRREVRNLVVMVSFSESVMWPAQSSCGGQSLLNNGMSLRLG